MSDLRKSSEKFVSHIPWDQDLLNYILASAVVCAFGQMFLEIDIDSYLNAAFMGALLYYIKKQYIVISRYYKRQTNQIVGDNQGKVKGELRRLKRQNHQVSVYYQLFMTALTFELWAQMISIFVESGLVVQTILMILANSCLFLQFYISKEHYLEMLGKPEICDLPPQVYVIKGSFYVLGLVFIKYIYTNSQSNLQLIFSSLLLFVLATNVWKSIGIYGYSSRKAVAYLIVGSIFNFLSETLRQIVLQQNHADDVKTVCSVLSFMAWYLLTSGLLLHIKAFTDCLIIELRVNLEN